MILCLAAAHASVFNTPRQAFFWLNHHVKIFFVIRKLLTSKHFYVILLHLSIQFLTSEIPSFKTITVLLRVITVL